MTLTSRANLMSFHTHDPYKGVNANKLTFCHVKVEEVTIENSLDDPSHDGNHVKEALKVEPPDPVEEVEGAIDAQTEQIVGSDGLGLAGLANHKELRQDGHRLKVNGKGPQNLS